MREKGAIVLGDKRRRGGSLGKMGRRVRWLAIAFVVAGCVGWSLDTMEEETRVRQARVDISRISHAARLFRADFGRCPLDVDELVSPPEGLSYLSKARDPWGGKYRITCPARLDPGGIDVVSGGPDGDDSGADNISSL
jgi:hypothetical protein